MLNLSDCRIKEDNNDMIEIGIEYSINQLERELYFKDDRPLSDECCMTTDKGKGRSALMKLDNH